MLGFDIADLYINENEFNVPSQFGVWNLRKVQSYDEIVSTRQSGQSATTFVAVNEDVNPKISFEDFDKTVHDLLDICLIFSFCTGKCVTPNGNLAGSDILYVEFGDHFLCCRSIEGIPQVNFLTSFSDMLQNGVQALDLKMPIDQIRLFIAYWLNGITCYSIEDLYLGICVMMDIVKQCEINDLKKDLTFFKGMEAASNRFGLPKLPHDFTKMRNDLVHEGKLSGSKFQNKSKSDCVTIIAVVLNWLDMYFGKILNIDAHIDLGNRFNEHNIGGLPSFSLFNK